MAKALDARDDDFASPPPEVSRPAIDQAQAPGTEPAAGKEPTILDRALSFLRKSEPPKRYYSPERPLPDRIAAMSEPVQHHFKDWLSDLRKRRVLN